MKVIWGKYSRFLHGKVFPFCSFYSTSLCSGLFYCFIFTISHSLILLLCLCLASTELFLNTCLFNILFSFRSSKCEWPLLLIWSCTLLYATFCFDRLCFFRGHFLVSIIWPPPPPAFFELLSQSTKILCILKIHLLSSLTSFPTPVSTRTTHTSLWSRVILDWSTTQGAEGTGCGGLRKTEGGAGGLNWFSTAETGWGGGSPG